MQKGTLPIGVPRSALLPLPLRDMYWLLALLVLLLSTVSDSQQPPPAAPRFDGDPFFAPGGGQQPPPPGTLPGALPPPPPGAPLGPGPRPGPLDPNGRSPNLSPFDPNNFIPRDNALGTPLGQWDGDNWFNNWQGNTIIREATYFVLASRVVRPGQIYTVAVTVLQAPLPITVRASISRNRVELTTDSKDVKEGIPEKLIMRVPPTSVPGDYKLRVEGLYDGILGGVAFVNETKVVFSQRSMTIFVQTDRPVYMQGQTVRFRAIPINTELRPFDGAIDVFMLDPNRHIMRRWLSRQSNLGTVSLEYSLSDQPVFGEWTVQVIAQGQIEEQKFLVEEFYQTRFEVNVTMPAFFFDTDRFIHGTVMANYTSGAPVSGNLTLMAEIRPRTRPGFLSPPPRIVYFHFDESYPFWFPKETFENRYRGLPHLKFFYGVHHFRYPIAELLPAAPNEEGFEVTVKATVGERFLDEVIDGYSTSRIYKSRLKVAFMGGSPQVFKPAMPFTTYLVVSYHDGSPLSKLRLFGSDLHITASLNGDQHRLDPRTLPVQPVQDGVWELKIDLKSLLGLNKQNRDFELANIRTMKIQATYLSQGDRAVTDLLLLSHFSPFNHHIKVSTSTSHAKVGEYIIFHVQSNYFMETFNYIVMAKGIILLAGDETMQNSIRTFAVPLSAEMAPAATIVVYQVGQYGDVVADSLTFPVNGISRNNFTVFINNRKARTGERVEVAIYGEPGSYVGLSGIDRAFYSMQAGNELSYSKVIERMASYDEITNGTHVHSWLSHEGLPDDSVYFPSSTFGVDANRTFEYLGLVVFSDVPVTRRPGFCNATLGFGECLDGQCYPFFKKCDGQRDCQDGTDEAGCPTYNRTEIGIFRKYRFSRIQRQYDNVWLWTDVNIGPHGRFIFDIDVPHRPAHWMVSAFSMSPTYGFGMVHTPLEYVGVLPFFMNVEMPTVCRQGEQVGIRVTVFNYLTRNLEATVVLAGSRDYKFVHVELNGIVRSYNPRTSFGEHQFFVFIRAQDSVTVYVPVVPTKLGDIDVTVMASSLIGKDVVTRRLHVEADGLPQYRHQSILLDLSNRAYVFQYMHVNITETPIIPYEEDRYYIFGSNKATVSLVGDVVGPIFPTMPVNATSLINLPMDCAEQTVFSFAAHLYTTLYMRYTNQRNRHLEKQSFHYMNILYQRQMSFMKHDGSFGLFRSDWNQSESSVWLTAYVVRVLQEASFYEWENFLYIDPEIISKSVTWLLDHQTDLGAFYEVSWLPDRKVNDSLHWPDDNVISRNVSLTAHVLITLETVKDLTGGLNSRVALAQNRAIQWLERNMPLLEQFGGPYEVSIVAYALMLSKAATAEAAFGILARHRRETDGLFYWGRIDVPPPPQKLENQKPFSLPRLPYEYDSSNIETTAYALLVYVARQELMMDRIVKWLNAQRLTDGGWASTQDTAIAMKALIEYTNRQRLRDVTQITVTIEATALPGQPKTLSVNPKNLASLQKIEIPEAWGTVKVTANGAGHAILQMTVQYNVDIVKYQTQPPVRSFDVMTRAIFHGRNQSHITYESCQRWTNFGESTKSGMAVLDVAIPTGYIIQQQKLDWYIRSKRVPLLQRARYTERKVLFYFDYLDGYHTCINFTIERWYPVANMSRYLPVRVYDYYAPERFNETIFDALPTYLLNICEVCGSSQCPYCPIYNLANTLKHSMLLMLVLPVFISLYQVFNTNTIGVFTRQL